MCYGDNQIILKQEFNIFLIPIFILIKTILIVRDTLKE